MSKPRVLLADDDIGVANALRRLVEADVELVGVVHDGLALVQAAVELRPDVIVTDLSMPSMNGLEAARLLRRDGVTAPIILLTMYSESQFADEAFRTGVSAYLPKFAAGENLVDAIYQALAGTDSTTDSTAAFPAREKPRQTVDVRAGLEFPN